MKVNASSLIALIALGHTYIKLVHCNNLGHAVPINANSIAVANTNANNVAGVNGNLNGIAETFSTAATVGMSNVGAELLGGFVGGCLSTFIIRISESIVDAVAGCIRRSKEEQMKKCRNNDDDDDAPYLRSPKREEEAAKPSGEVKEPKNKVKKPNEVTKPHNGEAKATKGGVPAAPAP
ncbi:microneme MIC11, putative [Babesia ovata]|uniref:Microneme MIC11, putative n=1 Tax=Babesia ovata TaxID=189622 RepID=A0A2H6KF34_9APIC|nr:microneme MIC11, putative [Babesia ovata]GBE61610.1 microneme MIC11, putative [Babesia ovata]